MVKLYNNADEFLAVYGNDAKGDNIIDKEEGPSERDLAKAAKEEPSRKELEAVTQGGFLDDDYDSYDDEYDDSDEYLGGFGHGSDFDSDNPYYD